MGGIFLVTQNIQRGDCSSLLNPYYFCNVEGGGGGGGGRSEERRVGLFWLFARL